MKKHVGSQIYKWKTERTKANRNEKKEVNEKDKILSELKTKLQGAQEKIKT